MVGDLEQTGQNAANGRDREFGNVAGHSSRDGTTSEARQHASRVHHVQVAASGRHEDGADQEDKHIRLERPLPADPLSQEETRKRTDQSAGLEGGGDIAGYFVRIAVGDAEARLEVGTSDCRSDKGGVIAETKPRVLEMIAIESI